MELSELMLIKSQRQGGASGGAPGPSVNVEVKFVEAQPREAPSVTLDVVDLAYEDIER